MSVPDRRAMVERPGENLAVRRRCALLNLALDSKVAPPIINHAVQGSLTAAPSRW